MQYILGIFYSIGFPLYLMSQIRKNEIYRKSGFSAIVAGALIHTTYLVTRGIEIGHIPAFGMHNSFILASWSVAVFFILLFFKYKVDLLGSAVAFFLSVMVIISYFLPESGFAGQNDFNIFMIAIHVFFTFFANAAFFVAFILGIFYIFQERNIKGKRHGVFFRKLPSLEIVEGAGNFCIVIGFVALTAGLASGIIWSKHIFGRFLAWDAKEVWSIISWVLYGAIIHGRLTSEWRGKKAAIMAIVGFFLIVFSFIGINVFMEGSHGEYFMGTGSIQG